MNSKRRGKGSGMTGGKELGPCPCCGVKDWHSYGGTEGYVKCHSCGTRLLPVSNAVEPEMWTKKRLWVLASWMEVNCLDACDRSGIWRLVREGQLSPKEFDDGKKERNDD